MNQELVYHLEGHDTDQDAYQALTDAISAVANNYQSNVYTAIWKTKSRDHGSEYRVIDDDSLVGEDTLIIEGASRGGKYEIFPKPNNPPIIRYYKPNGDIGWSEEAISLIITSGDFGYSKEETGPAILEFVKDKFGL